jgi:hypothetical protein
LIYCERDTSLARDGKHCWEGYQMQRFVFQMHCRRIWDLGCGGWEVA